MLLAKEFVEYLGRQVAVRLASNMIEISNRTAGARCS